MGLITSDCAPCRRVRAAEPCAGRAVQPWELGGESLTIADKFSAQQLQQHLPPPSWPVLQIRTGGALRLVCAD